MGEGLPSRQAAHAGGCAHRVQARGVQPIRRSRANWALKSIAGNKPVTPYYFSSLSEEEVCREKKTGTRGDTILVLGQYFPYKGLDVALEAARMDPGRRYCFAGMGGRTEKFLREQSVPANVQVISFLQTKAMFRNQSMPTLHRVSSATIPICR